MLTLENISKIYQGRLPYQALEDVSFSMSAGEFVAVMVHLGVESRPCLILSERQTAFHLERFS